MKKIIFIIAIMGFTTGAFAQSEKYTAAMKTNLAAFDTAFANPQSMLTLSNNFERIANAEKNQWLPFYYAALSQLNYAFLQPDNKQYEELATKAENFIKSAEALQPNNSELSVLKAMVSTVRLLVDPQTRYMQYGQEIDTHLKTAMQQDPNNPRPWYLQAENFINTPEQFGGGCKPAAESIKTALEKFASFKPASELDPNWGKDRMDQVAKGCEGK